MRHKKMACGLFAALTLASMSTASAQTTTTTTTTTPPSSRFQLTLRPYAVQPGGTIEVVLKSNATLDSGCGRTASSPGFVAPINLSFATHTISAGSGPVITTAGEYEVTVPCSSGGPVTAKFTILKGHTPPPTTPTKPPTRVTPIGPPQTGGGGTARSGA